MKILFTLKNFPPSNFGGVAAAMYPVIKELCKAPENNVKVLTTSYKIIKGRSPKTNCWTIFDGIPIIYVKSNAVFRYFFEGLRQIKNSDYIFLNGIFFVPNLLFLLVGVIFKRKIFLLPHGELLKPALRTKYWKKCIYLWLMKGFTNNVTLITTSKQESIRTQEVFPYLEVKIIPIFLDLNTPVNLIKLNQFLFVGRIARIKKIENIILACAYSKKFVSKNYKLVIAGPTDKEFLPYRRELEKLVISNNLQFNIEFVGEVNSPEKEKLFSQSKSLFVVSDSENFSNVVVESLSQGTPVIASKGTPWDSLINHNAGFWIDNSPRSIAGKMDEIITMEDKVHKEMSINCISLSQKFTKQKILPLWFELMK